MVKRTLLTLLATLVLATGAARVLAQHESTHGAGQQAVPGGHGAEMEQTSGAHEAGGHDSAAAKPALLPNPADPQTWYAALWVVIIFVIMLAILYPTAWKNVLAGLKKREERIRSDIAEAEAARARAETTLNEYSAKLASAEDNIRNMLASATADGEKLATSIRMKAQQEAEEIKERANRDIEAARDAALREIYERTAELATSVAEKIIRRNLNPQDQQDLVRESLEQLQTVK